MAAEEKVEFSARVEATDYAEFVGLVPVHGATTWFIRGALKQFLASCKRDPTLAEKMQEAVKEFMQDPFKL